MHLTKLINGKLLRQVVLCSVSICGFLSSFAQGSSAVKSLRTYLAFSDKLDPAHVATMADLEISNALASTLVTFDGERQIRASLSDRWNTVSINKIQFHLSPKSKWSDGSTISAQDWVKSFERAKKYYAGDLKSFFEIIVSIKSIQLDILEMELSKPVSESGIIQKLCEPMYGLTFVDSKGQLDFSKSSGPFVLKKKTNDEVALKVNSLWYSYVKGMPIEVEIRRPSRVDLFATFLTDDWANVVSGASLNKLTFLDDLKKKGLNTWQRSFDKTFSLFPSQRFIKQQGNILFQKFGKDINREFLLTGWSGYKLAEQFFPRGYELWSSKGPVIQEPKNLPSIKSPLKVILVENSFALDLQTRLATELKRVFKVDANIEIIPLQEVSTRLKLGNFDILASNLAVADPNFEGAMSFFIERDPPFIQSSVAPFDFAEQSKTTRGLSSAIERAEKMRLIIVKAQEAGFVLPLFHFSSFAISKPGVDLSNVPNSDESVAFSKVRM